LLQVESPHPGDGSGRANWPARFALCQLLTTLPLGGCNGDDDEDERPRENRAVSGPAVRELAGRLGEMTRAQVFRQLKATPVSSRKALSRRDPKRPNRPRVRFTCYRFDVKGSRSADHFAELCFRNNRILASVGVTEPGGAEVGGGAAPGLGVPGP